MSLYRIPSDVVYFPYATVTVQVYFFFLYAALILAVPFALAVTFPLPLTVATFLLLVVHVTFLAIAPFNFSFFVVAGAIVTAFSLKDTPAAFTSFASPITNTPINTKRVIKHAAAFCFHDISFIWPPPSAMAFYLNTFIILVEIFIVNS